MRNLLASVLLCTAVLAMAGCESLGNVEDAPPYSVERTASHEQTVVVEEPAPVEPVATAPEPKQCSCDCSDWKERALKAEKELSQCRVAGERVRETFREELTK